MTIPQHRPSPSNRNAYRCRFLFSTLHRALHLHLPDDRLLMASAGTASSDGAYQAGKVPGLPGLAKRSLVRAGVLKEFLLGAKKLRRPGIAAKLMKLTARLAVVVGLLAAAYLLGYSSGRRCASDLQSVF